MFCLVLLLSWTSWCLRRPRYYAKSLEIDSESVNAKPNDMLMNNEKNECNHRKKRQQKLPACIFGHLSAPTPENRNCEISLFSLCNQFLNQSVRSTNVQVWQSVEGSHAVDTTSLCVTSSRQQQDQLHPTESAQESQRRSDSYDDSTDHSRNDWTMSKSKSNETFWSLWAATQDRFQQELLTCFVIIYKVALFPLKSRHEPYSPVICQSSSHDNSITAYFILIATTTNPSKFLILVSRIQVIEQPFTTTPSVDTSVLVLLVRLEEAGEERFMSGAGFPWSCPPRSREREAAPVATCNDGRSSLKTSCFEISTVPISSTCRTTWSYLQDLVAMFHTRKCPSLLPVNKMLGLRKSMLVISSIPSMLPLGMSWKKGECNKKRKIDWCLL